MIKMVFIDLVEDNTDGRVSCLQVGKNSLRVVGVLPHGYEFLPATGDDRDLLVEFLNSLDYEE